MYSRIVIALDESPQAKRALTTAIELAKSLGAELRLITVSEPLPVYAALIDSEIPGGRQMLLEERNTFYRNLQNEAIRDASAAGLAVQAKIVEGNEVQSIVDHIAETGADLLVIGRRHHASIGNMLGRTVHSVAEKARCSILAVY